MLGLEHEMKAMPDQLFSVLLVTSFALLNVYLENLSSFHLLSKIYCVLDAVLGAGDVEEN